MNRKNILYIVFLIIVSLLPAAAQVSFGVRTGGAYSSMVYKLNDRVESGARFGYSLAGVLDIPVWREFSLRPEAAFVSQGGTHSRSFNDGTVLVFTQTDYHYYSIQIPVNIYYTFTFSEVKVNLFGGPVADFSLSGRKKENGMSSDIRFGAGEGNDLKPFDFGVSIGLGAEYSNFTFAIHTVCGTFDRRTVKNEGTSPVYQNNVTFSLGYFIRSH